MTNIASRIARLEQNAGHTRSGRVITLRPQGGSEADAEAFLIRQGIVVDHRKDLLVNLQTIFLDRQDNAVVPEDFGLELVNVTEIRR